MAPATSRAESVTAPSPPDGEGIERGLAARFIGAGFDGAQSSRSAHAELPPPCSLGKPVPQTFLVGVVAAFGLRVNAVEGADRPLMRICLALLDGFLFRISRLWRLPSRKSSGPPGKPLVSSWPSNFITSATAAIPRPHFVTVAEIFKRFRRGDTPAMMTYTSPPCPLALRTRHLPFKPSIISQFGFKVVLLNVQGKLSGWSERNRSNSARAASRVG